MAQAKRWGLEVWHEALVCFPCEDKVASDKDQLAQLQNVIADINTTIEKPGKAMIPHDDILLYARHVAMLCIAAMSTAWHVL